MGAGYHGGFGSTSGSAIGNAGSDGEKEIDENLKKELRNNNIKFNEKDMVFITRDKTGQIIWLENGNSSAGLKHILDGKAGSPGHAKDFEKAFGVKRNDVGSYLKKVIQNGTVISNKIVSIGSGRQGYERVYEYKGNYYTMTGIGTNGFIVSAYPVRKDDL